MKVRVTSQLQDTAIHGTGLSGKQLVAPGDNAGYEIWEICVTPGTTSKLVAPYSQEYNHIYYCFYGTPHITVSTGESLQMAADSMLTLPGHLTATLKASSKTRLYVTYIKKSDEIEAPKKHLYTKLDDLINTERDIDWKHGHSRRFLVKADGFNVSLHNTFANHSTTSSLQYKNQIEAVYYIQGCGKYVWDQGTKENAFDLSHLEAGDGTMFLMDEHDPHDIVVGDRDCFCLCVFYPPLKGTENHDFSKEGNSVY